MEIKINMFHTRHFAMKWSEFAQSCPTLCDPMDCSLLGSSVHGIFQARVLEWVAISFSIICLFLKNCKTKLHWSSILRWLQLAKFEYWYSIFFLIHHSLNTLWCLLPPAYLVHLCNFPFLQAFECTVSVLKSGFSLQLYWYSLLEGC